ncbi:DUF4034 domain-containing protein [Lysobacter gummosus]|uniref:DUF4034 domain-containing protein n=1 Tax=Lysobacter gummosus TaxID=262324 RepID=UPI0036319ECD
MVLMMAGATQACAEPSPAVPSAPTSRLVSPPSPEGARQAAEYRRTAAEREALRQRQLDAAINAGSELEVREALTLRARQLYAARDFAQLDLFYDDYALKSARTPSGLWKSGFWLSGIYMHGATEEAYRANEEVLKRWQRERPQSALVRLLRAHLMVNRAWEFRGTDYAVEVEKRNWRPFFDLLRQAHDYLEAEKNVASTRPEYYSLMIRIMMAQQKSAFAVFDEGREKFPTYYPIYFAMMEYLLPKWHGSLDQVEHFAAESVARTQQAEGRTMYARIYWAAAQGELRENVFTKFKASWPRMREGFEDVIARYPDQWNLQNYASFACDAGDDETLRKLFERVREPSLDGAWRSRTRYVACGRRVGKFKD